VAADASKERGERSQSPAPDGCITPSIVWPNRKSNFQLAYVFGAQAVLIWGRPRFTADVDVTVRLEPEEPDRLIEALANEQFVLRVRDARDFVAQGAGPSLRSHSHESAA
jgi:hypothetical protein